MTWLCLRERGAPLTPLSGARLPPALDRGTLVVEFDLGRLARSAGPVFRLPPDPSARRIFALEPGLDGRLHLFRRQGDRASHICVGLGRDPDAGPLRLSFHWDTSFGRSLLTAEHLVRGALRQQESRCALPLLAHEIGGLFAPEPGAPELHPCVSWIGLADHWQVTGPLPGIGPETPIDTPDGPCPIARLRPGHRVRTADAGDCVVRWQGRVTLPEAGGFRSVRLRAPHFGLSRDIVLRAAQPVAVAGVDLEYLFGETEAYVEARDLVNGHSVLWEAGTPITTSHGILLDRPALLCVGSLRLESLYLGWLAGTPALARTTAPGALAEGGRMPLHGARTRRMLRPFEAEALLRARAVSLSPIAA